MRPFVAFALALGLVSFASAQKLPPGWSSSSPESYRHDASTLVFGTKLARFQLAMPPEVFGASGVSAINYMGASASKLTIYVIPPDQLPTPADESEFMSAIAGIYQVLPKVQDGSVGTFLLTEDGRENRGRIATFKFQAQNRAMGTLLVVVAARQHILKFRATYPAAEEQKILVHVGEALSAMLGQDVELVTGPAK